VSVLRDGVAAVMESTALVVLAYYLVVNGAYLLVHLAALFELRDELRADEWGPMFRPFESPFLPGVAICVPAYDEEPVVVESVQSMLDTNYPDVEVVVVNDGSTDGTLDALVEAFDLVAVDAPPPLDVDCEPVHAVYRSRDALDLTVVDKDNGGRSDALNAAVWLTDQPLFCAVDADSVIDRDGLLDVVRPFLADPERTVATGGTIRVVNGCDVDGGQVTRVGLPDGLLARLQVSEYLRAFYSGRLGLDRLNGLLLISGAFGVFRTDVVREVGGYDTDNVTEDFELVMRLHRHLTAAGRDYRVEFVPGPVVWTEVPETRAALSRQRTRWYRGLLATLRQYRSMVGNRRYGPLGWFVLPAFVLAEALGPLVEGFGYALVVVGFALGLVDPWFAAAYFAITVGVGLVLSFFGVYSEVWSYRRYDRPRQVCSLLWLGVVENFGYRQWKTLVAWRGLFEYLRGVDSWGEMARSGFDDA
jgi:cellulose synthase/poly-beta-1,6-N-acetylglucosamine synthase-like glycosyltransferase